MPRGSVCPFMSAGLIPYSPHGEEPRHSQKARQNPEIEGAKFQGVEARRAADRAGAGGTAQSRDQSRRKRHRLVHRIAAAAGQFLGPPLRRRSRRASRPGVDARDGDDVAKRDAAVRPPPEPSPAAGEGQGAAMPPRAPASIESPQANYGTSATIPTLDPELAKQLGFTTEEEDAAAMARPPRNKMEALGVAATADALESLIRDGRPEFKGEDGQMKIWTPHRPPRPEKSEGGVPLRHQVRIRAEGRPAHRDRRTGRGHQRATTAPRCCSASPAPARPTPWPR